MTTTVLATPPKKRRAIIRKTPRLKMNKLVRDPLTGLVVTAKRPGRKPITSEDVARALGEFP